MIGKRAFVQAALAAAALWGAGQGRWARACAQQALSQDDLLAAPPFGQVTLIHLTDLHAQLTPLWFREPATNRGVGTEDGVPPHLTGRTFLDHYGIAPGSAEAHALTSEDFTALARSYGRMGGLDRVATVVAAIRADRPGALLLDGGDSWHGSLTALRTRGQDMVEALAALGVDAMTSHWEWTYGQDRVREIVAGLPFPFLGANVFDAEWDEPALPPHAVFDRGGVTVGVIGQAFPYVPVAHPGWLAPDYRFGLREARVQALVEELRAQGVGLVVLLSHNGFDADRKMAARVRGIDVILSGHTHDALPAPVWVGETALIASGSNGKFVSRVDLAVTGGRMTGLRHRLIPVFADAITPDPAMAARIAASRAPFADDLAAVAGVTETLLYRRGTVNGTWDDLICDALRARLDAPIALSPGLRWGPSLLPGDPVRREDIWAATGLTYGATTRREMTGAALKALLEDVADNSFNPDPYARQGGDMVRLGGVTCALDPAAPMGRRVSDLRLAEGGAEVADDKTYPVAGWASTGPRADGPQIWDVVEDHVRALGTVRLPAREAVRLVPA